MANIDIDISTYIKKISEINTYSPYKKIELITSVLTKNMRSSAEYKYIIRNNVYLRNIINSLEEADLDSITSDSKVSYILEDYNEYEYSSLDFDTTKNTDALNELINYYTHYYPNLLSDEETKELVLKAKNGDKNARDKIINSNWRLVLYIASKYQNRGLELTDLFQEGNIGFMKAINLFDINKGVKLTTYASWWIRHAAQRAIENSGRLIRLTTKYEMQLQSLKREIDKLQNILNRKPTIDEIAKQINMPKEKVEEMLSIPEVTVSLNQTLPFYNEVTATYEDVISDLNDSSLEEKMEDLEFRENIEGCLNKLSEKRKEVLKMYYGFYDEREYTLEEIGKRLKITRERVRQIKNKAEKELIVLLNEEKLVDNLDLLEEKEIKQSIIIKTNKQATSIYDYFYTESKEDIDLAISCLNEDMQQIV